MDTTRDCKGCSASVWVTEEEMEQLLKELKLAPENSVSSEVYQQRLDLCKACPSLIYGTTCRHCGCLVKYKAMFKDKQCALPDGPRW